ncbi:replicative DNA helicase [Posidoniimonas corsicana]|uniref:Replicative DNA helicase n=1 Tax=Posidoniimonas corsicana TaxID=1938618 RepID=A0A5C5VEF5_9BACT|nr:DnaB-like helicase C-terminal domain-containing protein [Posidoniimonas corsicana]TWT37016.1 replicative DNA helicase [Posidoniimonas corsicana]
MRSSLIRANYQTAADAFDQWRENLLTGTPPKLYPVGEGELAQIEVGPHLVTLFGGAPGAGKTAFVMQSVVDALRLDPDLRAVVLNIEMPPAVLLDRQLSRLSGIPAEMIRYRRLGEEHGERLDAGMSALEEIAERLCFVRPPFDLANLAATADAFGGDLVTLDYIQRIAPPGQHGDKRGAVDATMNYLRQFADAGAAVVGVAAVGRSKDKSGRSTYGGDSLSLASFRESSELEFGADDAFILAPDDDDPSPVRCVTLKHLKARHTEPRDLRLRFDRTCQSFTVDDGGLPDSGKFESAISDLWSRTTAAEEESVS